MIILNDRIKVKEKDMAKKAVNYINNKTLYAAMIEHRLKLTESKEQEKPKPQVSNYIGESILLICNNLAKKPNFSGYTYKQDMISDGIIDCVAAVDNFNPDKTNNPFAYFTQIAWNAFIRRIAKEKKQTYVKHKNYENTFLMGHHGGDAHAQLVSNEFSDEIIRSYENKLTKIKKPGKLVGVEVFSEESIETEI
jgi:DNA-directed RNA polymerase specialized sigma subunit